ncbi:unnamed protein product [Callosobruchus maculatus]|uniref:Nose resistant-to-fluoxetine protein N-terminal domain-containing protein n=1 Tax=Callosobruchus maculatus TaxID=64391 RepID=A0A653CCM2_CALMS|nr:unnamed protein product [Callosobruchus maculatus]
MRGSLTVYVALFAVFRSDFCSGIYLDDILRENDTADDLLEMYIPTMRAQGVECRRHSVFYAEELKKYRLWAAEMFDATTKFPSGVLYGATYDFGNFDECLEIKVPYDKNEFHGKYCMAKFIIVPPSENTISTAVNSFDYEHEDYTTYYNFTVWDKIISYRSRQRNPRNEMNFAFCLPSSCNYEDLQYSLQQLVTEFTNKTNYKLEVEVDKGHCQIDEVTVLERGDKIYLFFVAVLLSLVIVASIYDIITKRDDFAIYRLKDGLHTLVTCFSCPRNIRKLTSNTTSKGTNNFNCMAGMKVYSMFCIILLHRNMFDFGSATSNPKVIEQYYSKFGLTFILNGPILVDTFFTISGFLATYLGLNYLAKSKRSNLLLLYFHRYIRMAPTYAVILAFYCTLLTKLGNGPLWKERVVSEQEKCKKVWWANLLFINNYVYTQYYCMFQSWYMACDMNAFIFVPILCLIMVKKPRLGVMITIVLMMASAITVFVTVLTYDEAPIILLYMKMLLQPNTDSTFLRIYIPGHMRAASYFVGVLAGYLKFKMVNENLKIPKKWVYLGWITSAPLMFASLHVAYIFYNVSVPAWYSALYASVHHVAWSASIAWMVIAISSGYGPWIEGILSWSPLVVLSRLSYTVYLCHGIIQMVTAGTIRHPRYASMFTSIHSTCADIILAYFLAFLLSILVESPLLALEKALLWKGNSQKNPSIKKEEITESNGLPTTT